MQGIVIDPTDKDHVILYDVLSTLSAREQTIIVYRFGLFGYNRTPLSLCSSLLGISRERVRQVEEDAIMKMRKEDIRNKVLKIKHLPLLEKIMGVCDCGCLYNGQQKLWVVGKSIICDKCMEAKKAA